MLDGCFKEGVIVGQNWGSSSSSSIFVDDEEEDRQQQHHRQFQQQQQAVEMVDTIQAAHQQYPHAAGPYKGFLGSSSGGGGDEFDRRSSVYNSWRGGTVAPNPFLKYYHAGNSSIAGDAEQRERQQERLIDYTSSANKNNNNKHYLHDMDLSSSSSRERALFPKPSTATATSSLSNSSLLLHEASVEHKNKKKKLVDGDEHLLSLRPPNSGLSDITTTGNTNGCSSPDHDSLHVPRINHLHHQGGGHQDGIDRPIDRDRVLVDGSPDHRHNHPGQQQQRPLGMDLLNILLECAQAVNRHDLDSAISLLAQLKQGASIYGDSMQRLTAHFAESLATRILSSSPPPFLSPAKLDLLHSFLLHRSSPSKGGGEGDDYLAAFTALYTVSPFFKLAHFTANQAIVEAVAGRSRIHVIDLDILQGFQWPSFIQALASRPGGPPSLLTLTGVGPSAATLCETGERLSSFAATFGVPFHFRPLVAGSLEELEMLLLGAGFEPRTGGAANGAACHLVEQQEHHQEQDVEAVAVNAVFQLHRLLNGPRPGWRKLESFLAGLRRMRPVAVTVVEQEAAHNAPDFIARFVEALHYYAAVFDSLDASLPQRNEERVRIEQLVFASQMRNIVSCEGEDRVERHEKMEFWSARMASCGFVQAPMSSHSVSQAKLLLQLCPCDGYRLVESPCHEWPVGAISLAWQQRLLLTASTWACS